MLRARLVLIPVAMVLHIDEIVPSDHPRNLRFIVHDRQMSEVLLPEQLKGARKRRLFVYNVRCTAHEIFQVHVVLELLFGEIFHLWSRMSFVTEKAPMRWHVLDCILKL